MKYWDNITAMAYAQAVKGIEHYGKSLEDNKELTDPKQIVEEAQQELIDALMYLEHLKENMK